MEAYSGSPRSGWKKWLLNRFVLVPVAILAVAGAWDLYASTHDDGLVVGQVLDAQGKPVEGADVTLWVFSFTTFAENRSVKTGADGSFRITGNPSHHIQLSAAKPGVGSSQRIPIRLYFRSQNTTLAAPLVLSGKA
jgi:hypothetical protein